MRIADGGGYAAPPQTTAPQRAAATHPVPHAAPAGAGSATGGSHSSATWDTPGDTIDLSKFHGPMLRMVQQEMQAEASAGTFNDGSPGESQNDARMVSILGADYQRSIGASVPGDKAPPRQNAVAQKDDTYYLNQYMQGKLQGQDPGQTQPQRLQNLMAGLGPAATYGYLTNLTPQQMSQFGVQKSFGQLVQSGALSPDDARQLVGGQRQYAVDDNTDGYSSDGANVASLVAGVKSNDPNTLAFKNAFAHASLDTGAAIQSGLQNGSIHGPYDNLTAQESERMYSQARTVLNSTSGNDDAKRAAFQQMVHDAQSFAGSKDSRSKTLANSIDAYAADTLASASPGAVSAELRSIGGFSADGSKDPTGIGPHGYIDPGSQLGQFLSRSMSGESAFASGAEFDPLGVNPTGTSGLLEKLASGNDQKLTAGILSNIADNFAQIPGQAAQLASSGALQKSITDALGSSFNRFANIDGFPNFSLSDENPASGFKKGSDGSPGVTGAAAQRLQILSAIESGPPFSPNQAKNFENVLYSHANGLAKYALGAPLAPTESQDASAVLGKDPTRKLAAQGAYAIMQSFMNGYAAEHVRAIAQAGAAKPTDTVGDVLQTLSKVDGYASLVPELTEVAAPVGGILGAAGDLHDAGLFKPASDSASKAALATLGAGDRISGGGSAFAEMANLYESFQDDPAQQQDQAAANTNATTASGLLSGGPYYSDTQSFFSAYDPPLNPSND